MNPDYPPTVDRRGRIPHPFIDSGSKVIESEREGVREGVREGERCAATVCGVFVSTATVSALDVLDVNSALREHSLPEWPWYWEASGWVSG